MVMEDRAGGGGQRKGPLVYHYDSWLDSGPFTKVHPVQLANCGYMSKVKI